MMSLSNDTPDISVIVCTYNRAESLRDTLRALGMQETADGLSVEILVVDNGSTDATRRVVQEEAQGSRWTIRYLFEARVGKSHALNRGIREARADWLAFTDDDVLPEPSWAQALHDAGRVHPADCVGGRILPLWAQEPPAWLVGHAPLLASLSLLDWGPNPVVGSIHCAYRMYGANMAFRKQIVEAIGPFRADLGVTGLKRMRGEDTDFVVRAYHAGKRLAYEPGAVVHHKVPVERMRLSYLRRLRFYEGRSMVLRGELARAPFPRWLARQCGEHGLQALWAYGRGRFEQGVHHEMAFWEQLGELVEIVKPSHANGALCA